MANPPSDLTIAIIQLVFFIPIVPLSIWLWVRYGFRLGAGAWRLVLMLALLRLISGSCAIAAQTYPSDSLYAAILSCDLVGTAPLFLLVLRLVERANNLYHAIPSNIFRLADTASLVGLVVGIYGANQALTSTLGDGKAFSVNAYMNAAMALFIVVLAVDLLGTASLAVPVLRGQPPMAGGVEDGAELGDNRAKHHESTDSAASSPADIDIERRSATATTTAAAAATTTTSATSQRSEVAACRKIILAAALAAPFLVVRMCFAAIGDFGDDVRFIPYLGDRALYLGMSVLMEVVAAYICLAVGFAVPPPPKPAVEKKEGSWWSRLRK